MTPERQVNIMVKVTPHDNFVPSTRDPWVRDYPDSDLIHRYPLARDLIRVASQFFHLRKDAVIYSGHVRDQLSDWGAEDVFTIYLWHEGEPVRSLTLPDLGYGGALHCETVGGRFEDVVGWDLIGSLTKDKKGGHSAESK